MATGTVTFTEYALGPVKRIKCVWVSTAGGAASDATANAYSGIIVSATTVPSVTAPTDDYDIVILDEDLADVMQGALANRDTANTEVAAPTVKQSVRGKLTFTVSAAGASKGGTIYLDIVGSKL